MLRRLLPALLLALLVLGGGWPAAASDEPAMDVVVVTGLLDARMIDFIASAIEESEADVVILQLDSSATLDPIGELVELVADPPVPVAAYAGPDPARVAGGALQVLAAAQISGAAPGVVLGPVAPTLAGDPVDAEEIAADQPSLPGSVLVGAVEVGDDLDGFLDLVEPSIGQFVVGLEGREVTVDGVQVMLHTAIEETVDGVVSLKPAGAVTFVEPGLVDATLRLGIGPETSFFFLIIGLSLAIFEFYAAGPGVAAVIAVISLMLGGYGAAVLPVQWWAVALMPAGLLLYTIDFQRNDLGWKSILGTVALLVSGLAFTDAAPQIVQTWWIVLIIVTGVALWFGFALTTVVRSRFSTQTIGRDHLVGRIGTADAAITPEGVVLVDGARWQARSTRQSGIAAGDEVIVRAVDGVVLEVDPAESE